MDSPQNLSPLENAEGNGSGEKNTGSIIGIIIIVLVLALGGLYFWGKRVASSEGGSASGGENAGNTNAPPE